MTRRGLCALAGGMVLAGLPKAASANQAVAYGPHSRQRLNIIRGRGAGPHPLVLMTGEGAMTSQARALATRGMTVAVVDRRQSAYGFHAYGGDVILALAWLRERSLALELDGRFAFWAEGQAASTALLIGRDRRYLERIGLGLRDLSGMVLVDMREVRDPTFTVPSAYGLQDPPAVYQTHIRKAADGAAFLSGLF